MAPRTLHPGWTADLGNLDRLGSEFHSADFEFAAGQNRCGECDLAHGRGSGETLSRVDRHVAAGTTPGVSEMGYPRPACGSRAAPTFG